MRLNTLWSPAPPATPGVYWWRRSWQWEPVVREIEQDMQVLSHRYCKYVPVAQVGGEWGEPYKETT